MDDDVHVLRCDLATSIKERDYLRERAESAAKDAEVWRHIAQEHYALLRRERDPKEKNYPIEGALDPLFRGYRSHGKYSQVFCSQCGGSFPGNYHGYSHCEDHEQWLNSNTRPT